MNRISRRDFCAFSVIACAAGATRARAASSSYPNRPITMIAPVAPGGLTDIIARTISEALGKRLNNPVIVYNKEGAGGTVGMAAAARAEPDGYTLILVFQGPTTVAPALYPNLSYDTFRDFTAISPVGYSHQFLTVGASTPFKNVKDVIEAAKRQPGKLNYGSAGVGSTAHLAGELLQQMAGIKLNHIPYKGEAPALRDVVGGVVEMTFSTIAGTKSLADAGLVRMIGVSTSTRASAAPTIPTIAESGLPGYNVPTWFGVMAPKKIPPAIVNRLYQEFTALLKDPAVRARLAQIDIESWQLDVPQFEHWLRGDAIRWKKVIETAHIKAG